MDQVSEAIFYIDAKTAEPPVRVQKPLSIYHSKLSNILKRMRRQESESGIQDLPLGNEN